MTSNPACTGRLAPPVKRKAVERWAVLLRLTGWETFGPMTTQQFSIPSVWDS